MKRLISTISAIQFKIKRLKSTSRIALILGLMAISAIVVFTRVGRPLKPGLQDFTEKASSENSVVPIAGPTLPLTKEYVYIGSRLVAVEEKKISKGVLPVALTASGDLSSTVASVKVSWEPPVEGAIDHYEIERGEASKGQTVRGEFSLLSTNSSTADCSSTKVCFEDSEIKPNTMYLYRVRAVFPDGSKSDYSNTDIATTFPLTKEQFNSDKTKASLETVNFKELQDAVSCVRALAELPPSNFTCPRSKTGDDISSCQLDNLQANLSEAVSRLGLEMPQITEVDNGKDELKSQFIEDLLSQMR